VGLCLQSEKNELPAPDTTPKTQIGSRQLQTASTKLKPYKSFGVRVGLLNQALELIDDLLTLPRC